MRLTKRDAGAAVFVAAAVVVYLMWLGDVTMTGVSTRAVAGLVFGLGWLACISNQSGVTDVYGAGGRRNASMPYIVTASAIGALALVAGIIAVAGESEPMLAVLIVSMVVLWALSTSRHLWTRDVSERTHRDDVPLHRAA